MYIFVASVVSTNCISMDNGHGVRSPQKLDLFRFYYSEWAQVGPCTRRRARGNSLWVGHFYHILEARAKNLAAGI